MWLRADAGVTQNAGAVSRWSDRSGNASDAVQATATAQPRLISNAINSHPVVRFDGKSSFMTFPLNLNGMTGVSVFMVASAATNTGGVSNGVTNAPLFWGETAYWGATFFNPLQTWVGYRFGTGQVGNVAIYTRPATIGTGASLTTAIKNSATETLYINGSQAMQQSGKLAALAKVATTGYLGEGLSNSMFQGDIAEIAVYNRAVSDTERQQIEGYLLSKYALRTSGSSDLTLGLTHSGQFVAGGTGITTPISGSYAEYLDANLLATTTRELSQRARNTGATYDVYR
jgi:hypothetical protein